MPDHEPTDDHLKAVDSQSEPGTLSENAQKAPLFLVFVEFRRVLIVLYDHDELENEERECDQDHKNAEEVLELDIGLIACQCERQQAQEHDQNVDQGRQSRQLTAKRHRHTQKHRLDEVKEEDLQVVIPCLLELKVGASLLLYAEIIHPA